MNILYTNIHRGDGGGQTTYVLSLVKDNPHNTFVACPAGSLLHRTLRDQGYKNYIDIDFPGKPKDYKAILKNTFALRRAIIEHDIDIVHTNGSPDNRMALYASLTMRKKFKVVFTKHNVIKFHGVISLLRLNLFNDAVIFVSDFFDLLGISSKNSKYHVIYNGIDLDHWKKKEPLQTSNKLTLISNAGTNRYKGWHHLMEAFAGLSEEERKRFSVVLLGRPAEDMTKEIADAERVYGFRFPGFSTDARPYLEKADIGFVLSYKEAYSFAAREMLAMGLPLIISDYPVLLDAITPNCGWETKLKDPESIRIILRKILSIRPEDLTIMKHAAREQAVTKCNITAMKEKTFQVYEKLMKK